MTTRKHPEPVKTPAKVSVPVKTTVTVTALDPVNYNGVLYQPGAVIEVDPQYIEAMLELGVVEKV